MGVDQQMKELVHRPIGVFDSGVGGLTVVRQIHRMFPHEEIIYLGDTARVPYGTKSPSTVKRFAIENSLFLEQEGVKMIVVACNTASAWALRELRERFDIPVIGVIQPGAFEAVNQSRQVRIGVIGTRATIQSGSYLKAIKELRPDARVFGKSCPLLVPLVEEGWTSHEVTLTILKEYLAPLLKRDITTLVLGCTHYPLLKRSIRKIIGSDIRLVDSASSCARFLSEKAEQFHLTIGASGRANGRLSAYVTDEPEKFNQLAKRFLGSSSVSATKIALPEIRP